MYVPSIARVMCATFIVLMEVLATFVLMMLPDNDLYYWECIGLNLLIIIGLFHIGDERIVSDLMHLNVAALIMQVVGLSIYWCEGQVEFYNYPIHLITLLQVLRLIIIREEDSDGLGQDHHWLSMVNNRNLRSH